MDLPNNEKVMDLKWEFKIKKDGEGSVKHDARLVAKEYVQEEGVDFEELFVPVAKMESVELPIALAVGIMEDTSNGCKIRVFEWRVRRRCVCESATGIHQRGRGTQGIKATQSLVRATARLSGMEHQT